MPPPQSFADANEAAVSSRSPGNRLIARVPAETLHPRSERETGVPTVPLDSEWVKTHAGPHHPRTSFTSPPPQPPPPAPGLQPPPPPTPAPHCPCRSNPVHLLRRVKASCVAVGLNPTCRAQRWGIGYRGAFTECENACSTCTLAKGRVRAVFVFCFFALCLAALQYQRNFSIRFSCKL